MTAAGWDSYLKAIYDATAGIVDKATWLLNFQSMMQAVTEGISPLVTAAWNSNDLALMSKLVEDAGVFAAFKNHSMQKELVSLLTVDGQTVSWNEFKKSAAPVLDQYNVNWLQTEYNQALSEAEMGKRWDDIVQDADLYPNIHYSAVKDSRTRSSHEALDGIILPVDHPFWDSHFPPIDWGCRCDAVATDRPVNRNGEVTAALEVVANRGPVAPGFDHNPGKDGKLFAASAGYYQNVPTNTAAELAEAALSLTVEHLEAMVKDTLKDAHVRYMEHKVTFPFGADSTAEANGTDHVVQALLTLLNKNNVQEVITNGTFAVDADHYYTWTLDNVRVKASQIVGRLMFHSLTIL